MTLRDNKIRWGVEQRLEFIEFRVFWENGINRGDLKKFFGVSTPQASNDLKLYQEKAPQNIEYNTKLKRYFTTDSFEPKFMKVDATHYLTHLTAIDRNAFDPEDTWIAELPPFSAVAIPRRNIDPNFFKKILSSVRNKRGLEIQYQSFSRPDPSWRTISPHAFGFDGMRWHTRAYCHRSKIYKDFILSRILEVGEQKNGISDKEPDNFWNDKIEVDLTTHPDCSEGQKRAIELDFDIKHDNVSVKMRHAMLFYFLNRQGFLGDNKDVICGRSKSAKAQHVVLADLELTQDLFNQVLGISSTSDER